jgi:hypothetical protein
MEGSNSPNGERNDDWQGFLRGVIGRLLAALLATGGALAFIAAVGGAIVWTRFRAAELPADQALDALRQGELIATGATTLALFGVLGVLAAAGVYLIDHDDQDDHDDQPSRGLSRGLLLLVAAEATVLSALLVDEKGWARFAITLEVIIILLLLCLAMTRVPTRWAYMVKGGVKEIPPKDGQDAQDSAQAPPPIAASGEVCRVEPTKPIVAISGAMQLFIVLVILVTLFAVGLSALLGVLDSLWAPIALACLSLVVLIPGAFFFARWLVDEEKRPSPSSLRLSREGWVVLILISVAVTVVPALVMWEWWLGIGIATAVALCGLAWLAASRTNERSYWYAVIVFASVPFLGAAAGIVRNADDPQVQPMALIRKADGPGEAIQGIYVAETKDRIYFASVATDGCSGDVVPGSGRMLSIPTSEVAAMALGPRQSVEEAGEKALEMSFALAPDSADATATGQQPEVIGDVPDEQATDSDASQGDGERRLEDPGPALRREFTDNQELDEDSARVGDSVTLEGEDFEDDPDGRTIRIGDVEARLDRDKEDDGWSDDAIRFNVPGRAKSGPVTLECKPLAGQLALRVKRKPHARLALRMSADSQRVVFDSSRSRDRGGEIVARGWELDGSSGRGTTVPRDVPTAFDPYEVTLEIEDDDGEKDLVAVAIWRLPLQDGEENPRRDQAIDAIRSRVEGGKSLQVVVDGHASTPDGLSTSAVTFSQGLVADVESDLLEGAPPGFPRPLTRAFGAGCSTGLVADSDVSVGRIDVFVLPVDAKVVPPPGCERRIE